MDSVTTLPPLKPRKMNGLSISVADDTSPIRHIINERGHADCPACAAAARLICAVDLDVAELPFSAAYKVWIDWKKPSIKPRSLEAYEGYFAALHVFFGETKLREIHPGHLREYQLLRSHNTGALWKKPAGPSYINHELNTLAQMLEYANLWERMKKFYRPLKLPKFTPKRVLDSDEEQVVFNFDPADPDLDLAYLVATITVNTSATPGELRGVRLEHVLLDNDPPELRIPSDTVKNEYRARRIPLNDPAKQAIEACLVRALKLGSCRPEHYLFPFRVKKNHYDPTRPGSRWWVRASFEKFRASSGVAWLRPHDLRHQAITRMLEAGFRAETVMSVAGHVSEAMMRHYSHLRMHAKVEVVNAIDPANFKVATAIRVGRTTK